MSYNILIFGGWYGSRNLGDDAILLGIREAFQSIDPNINLTSFTSDSNYTSLMCGVNTYIPHIHPPTPLNIYRFVKEIKKYDLILVSGGTPLYDYAYLNKIITMYTPHLLKVPLAFFGVSSKPLGSKFGKFLTKNIVNTSKSISVREPYSKYLLKSIGVKREIKLTGDSAIAMDSISSQIGRSILQDKGLKPSDSIIGICPRYLSLDYKRHHHEPVTESQIKKTISELSKLMVSLVNNDYKVCLIPYHAIPPDDDRIMIEDMCKNIPEDQIIVIDNVSNPKEMLSLMSNLSLNIGMRLHSVILAASQNVPSITIDYDMKIGGFMEYCGLSDYNIPINRISQNIILDKIELIETNRSSIKTQLNQRISYMKGAIYDDMSEVMKILSNLKS